MKHLLLLQAVLILVGSVFPVSVARFPDLKDRGKKIWELHESIVDRIEIGKE